MEGIGIDAYDRFYAALADTTSEVAQEQIWLDAMSKGFGASSIQDLEDKAMAYLKEHIDEFIERFNANHPEP